MKIEEFLELMEFLPLRWELDMADPEYLSLCTTRYRPGRGDSSEHDRHGLFQYWLKREPSKETLLDLVRLSFVDPDESMTASVRAAILRSKNCDAEAQRLVRSGPPTQARDRELTWRRSGRFPDTDRGVDDFRS